VAERERLVRAWETGDSTQREFAQAHRIRYGTFRNWVRAHAVAAEPATSEPSVQFQEVRLLDRQAPAPTRTPMAWEAEVRLPSGVVLMLGPGVSASRVRELMEAVRC